MLRADSVRRALRDAAGSLARTSALPARPPGCRWGWAGSGSCSVCRRTPRPSRRRLGRSRIAVSSDCMTSRITVRRDHLHRPQQAGRPQRMAEHRGDPLQRPRHPGPGPGHGREQPADRVPGPPVGDDLDVRVGVGIDARGDRDRAGEVAAVVGCGHRLDRLGVGPHQVTEPRREAGQRSAVPAVGEQLVGSQGARGDHDPARREGRALGVAAMRRGGPSSPRSRRSRRRRRGGGSRSPVARAAPRRRGARRTTGSS